jgi:hypothetical protein
VSCALAQNIILQNSLLPSYTLYYFLPFPFLSVNFCLIPHSSRSTKALPTGRCTVTYSGLSSWNWVELLLRPYTLRWLQWGFQNRGPGGECPVSKLIFGVCFLKFSFGCTHLCWFCRALAVLSSNLTPRVTPSAVIVKYIIFDIYWLSSGLALDIWYVYWTAPGAVKYCKIYWVYCVCIMASFGCIFWVNFYTPIGAFLHWTAFIVTLPLPDIRIILSGGFWTLVQCIHANQTRFPLTYHRYYFHILMELKWIVWTDTDIGITE